MRSTEFRSRFVLYVLLLTYISNQWCRYLLNYLYAVPGSAASNGFKPGFMAKLMLKDLRLSQAASHMAASPTPIGAAATAAFQQHVNNGHGDLDMSSICKLIDPEVE